MGRDVWVRARLGWKGLTASEYVDEGVPLLATPNIKSAEIDYAGANKISIERFEESPEIALREGDVLLTKDGSTIGTVNVVRDLPMPATVNGSIAVLTPTSDLEGRFLYWFIVSSYAQSMFDRLREGMGVPHLFQRDMNRINMPHPPLQQQRAIADYLDRETAQIDTLIAKQEQLIATLRERRAAVREAAVAAMPASGPRLKHLVRSVRQGWSPQCNAWPADGVTTWAVLKAGAANGGVFRPSENKELPGEEVPRPEAVVREGDLVVSRANTRDLVGSAAVVEGQYPRLMLCDKLYAFTLDPSSAIPRFVAMTLGSRRWRDLIELQATGASHSMLNISQSDIVNLPMPVPTLDEQRAILRRIDDQTAKIDALMVKTERFIELSKERRTALITAAVTGQIDVRASA